MGEEAGGGGRVTSVRRGGVASDPGGRGRLYIVATPIGNLADITLRALEILRAVPLIAAEDTRHTRGLLTRYEISTRLVSYHARNAEARGPELLARLAAGDDIALVTDAGTPAISDPGAELVAAWAATGGAVVPIPGPSATLAAISATGIAGPRWSFEGFLPRRGRERRDRLARVAADDRGCVIFEASNRLAATLTDLAETCGGSRPAAVCRELTKLHEEIRHGTLAGLAQAAADGDLLARGEVVIVLGGPRAREGAVATPDGTAPSGGSGPGPDGPADALATARAEVERLVASGVARGVAARQVSAATSIPRRALYGSPPND